MNAKPENYSHSEHLTPQKPAVDLAEAYISKVNAALENSREDLVAELELAYQAELQQSAP
jgi:hypothetical protein